MDSYKKIEQNLMRTDKLAYLFFIMSSLTLIWLFLNFGEREGYIVSEIKWSIFELAVTINLIFIAASIWRFVKRKNVQKNEMILFIVGIVPMISLIIYEVFK